MTGSNYVYTITLDAGQASAGLSSMQSNMQAATRSAGGLREAIDKVGRAAFAFVNISDAAERLVRSFEDMSEPGLKLNETMHSLSAVSGVTGKSLQRIEGYARKAAKTFGGSASDSVEAYQLVLSQLGPHIAQVPEALAAMGDSIKTTSKLMGNDTAAAAEVLTTALNQYQVSLDDPIKASAEMARMMNVMAAAGQAGSAELPTIKEALKQAGMMAKTSGVSFEEANAAIQMLDKAGKKGSEGGVALRNVMSTLAQGRFLPQDVQEELAAAGVSIDRLTDKSLSLTDRLRGLSPIMSDQALVSKMFGRENAASAIALMSVLDPIDELTATISGSNSAYEQAGIIMDSDVEKMSRFQAKIDDIKIGLYNVYSGIYPYITGLGSAMQNMANMAIAANAMHALSETALGVAIRRRTSAMWKSVTAAYAAGGSLGVFSAAAAVAKMACHGLAAGFRAIGTAIYAIPIVGWIAAGIALVVKGIQLLWTKSEGFRRVVFGIWEVVKGVFAAAYSKISGFVEGVRGVFAGVREWITGFFAGIHERITGLFASIREKLAGIVEPVARVLNRLKTMFTDFAAKVKEKLDPVFEPFRRFGRWVGGLFGAGSEKGSESWAKDHPNKPAVADITVPEVAEVGDMQAALSGGSAAKDGFSAGKIDLNNVKGSTDYAAVAAKLQPKAFAGLGGGKAGSPASMPAVSKPAAGEAASVMPELPSFFEQPEDKMVGILQRIADDTRRIAATMAVTASAAMPLAAQVDPVSPAPVELSRPAPLAIAPVERPEARGNGGKTVQFAKFCDRVEITVPAGTTGNQVDVILNELMRRINDAIE